MLASEAMRIGAAATPKADATLYDDKGGSCALGAIMFGMLGRRSFISLRIHFPWMFQPMSCPMCQRINNIDAILAHLNNSPGAYNHGHDISREAIADYLEGIEVMLGLRPMPSSEKPGTIEVEELELINV